MSNVEILIHPNFRKGVLGGRWNIFLPWAPLGVIQETLKVPSNVFERHKLFNEFLGNIQDTPFLADQREYLLYFAVPLFVLCIVREDAVGAVGELFTYYDPDIISKTRHFVSLYQTQLRDALEDPQSRGPLLKDIHGFWSLLLQAQEEQGARLVSIFQRQLQPLPPHLPLHLVGKLGLCSLYPDHGEIVNELQQITFPRLRLLTEHQRAPLPSEVFKALLGGFIVKPGTQADFLLEFRSTVWEAHLRTPPKLTGLRLPLVSDMGYTTQDILSQVLCFGLPNWAQVWTEMGWPFTHEIQRRLRFLKKENWRPKPGDFLRIILSLVHL